MKYAEKLQDPRWQKKRLEVLERDGWKCVRCGQDKKTLHVHHTLYLPEREPWEYNDSYLLTLCKKCHEVEPTDFEFEADDLIKILHFWGWLSKDVRRLTEALFQGQIQPSQFRGTRT